MDAVKKLPPSRRFLKHNLPKSPAKKDVKSASTKPGTKSTTKSQAKKSQKSQIKKPCRKLNHETTCPEENPLVAPRQGSWIPGLINNRSLTGRCLLDSAQRLSHSWSNIQKTMKDNTQIISFSLCHGLQLAVPPKMDDSKFELCSRVGSKHAGSKMSFKPTGSRMFR